MLYYCSIIVMRYIIFVHYILFIRPLIFSQVQLCKNSTVYFRRTQLYAVSISELISSDTRRVASV